MARFGFFKSVKHLAWGDYEARRKIYARSQICGIGTGDASSRDEKIIFVLAACRSEKKELLIRVENKKCVTLGGGAD